MFDIVRWWCVNTCSNVCSVVRRWLFNATVWWYPTCTGWVCGKFRAAQLCDGMKHEMLLGALTYRDASAYHMSVLDLL